MLLVFLVPLLIIVLLIWYKVRKNRMLNETMLKLAEKGVVPPAEAMDALDANRRGDGAPPTTARCTSRRSSPPAARVVRPAQGRDPDRASVSPSRSIRMLDDGTPNWLGLVLLFLGVGYCVLWFFEDRSRARGTPRRYAVRQVEASDG